MVQFPGRHLLAENDACVVPEQSSPAYAPLKDIPELATVADPANVPLHGTSSVKVKPNVRPETVPATVPLVAPAVAAVLYSPVIVFPDWTNVNTMGYDAFGG